MNHDESKLPKWVQDKLEKQRESIEYYKKYGQGLEKQIDHLQKINYENLQKNKPTRAD